MLATAIVCPSPARADDEPSLWTRIALPADAGNPDGPVDESDDVVTGIYFKDLDHGVVTANDFKTGGVIYSATAKTLPDVLYRGAHHAADEAQSVSFHGFTTQPDGSLVFLLFPSGNEVIRCDKDFKFNRTGIGRGDSIDQRQLFIRQSAGGKWWYFTENGVSTADDAPSKATEWTTVWSPETSPTVPNPLPANAPEAPNHVTSDGSMDSWAYVSPDGTLAAYPLKHSVAIAASRDGGKTWKTVALPGAPVPKADEPDTSGYGPTAMTFTDKSHGWLCGVGSGTPYVYATTDGGVTWTPGTLPEKVTAHAHELDFHFHAMFFAPDNKTGWIVGQGGDSHRPIVLRTTDGGATWKDKFGGPGGLILLTPPDGVDLISGFALDADHVWIGGRNGSLFYTDKASQ